MDGSLGLRDWYILIVCSALSGDDFPGTRLGPVGSSGAQVNSLPKRIYCPWHLGADAGRVCVW